MLLRASSKATDNNVSLSCAIGDPIATDIEHGELEIGQISSLLKSVRPAGDIISEIVNDYREIGGPKLGQRFEF